MALAESATTTAIEAALAASKEHGPTSKEAMLAWETVEEMNASDNRCVSVCCGLIFIEIVNINYLAMMVSSLLMDFSLIT